jgi:hypothetical protein
VFRTGAVIVPSGLATRYISLGTPRSFHAEEISKAQVLRVLNEYLVGPHEPLTMTDACLTVVPQSEAKLFMLVS